MTKIQSFIEWLSFHPSADDIARALATDYLAEFGVSAVRFGRTNSDDSVVILGQFGYTNAEELRNKVIPGVQWRAFDLPEVDIITGRNKNKWSPSSKMCVVTLRDRGVMQGHVIIEFSNEITEAQKHLVQETIESYCLPIALYLSFQTNPVISKPLNNNSNSREIQPNQLTARQKLILGGMVEGKTNHELATEMGFSVSTIRHETMRIYQALAVSDRREAAKKAMVLGIL